jgi:small nuclear ribonucleoprotein
MPRRPLDVLEEALGDPVAVLLKDGTRYAGTLAGFDQHMNVVLDDVEIESGGDPEETADSSEAEDDGSGEDTIVIRGDNVVSIVP